jgi:hypothetical protein
MKLKGIFWRTTFLLGIMSLPTLGNVQNSSVASIQTEYKHYFASTYTTLEIQTVYTNPFDHPVYLPGCRGITKGIEKLIDNEWVYIYPSHFACGTKPIPQVNANATYIDSFINWNEIFYVNPGFIIDGEYRIVWEVYSSLDDEKEYVNRETRLPLEQRISNTFRIEPL